MKKLDRFIVKHFANLSLVITFTIIIVSFVVAGISAGWKINWIVTIICCILLICDWIYLIKCWIKM
jgi:hypothetical protein